MLFSLWCLVAYGEDKYKAELVKACKKPSFAHLYFVCVYSTHSCEVCWCKKECQEPVRLARTQMNAATDCHRAQIYPEIYNATSDLHVQNSSRLPTPIDLLKHMTLA